MYPLFQTASATSEQEDADRAMAMRLQERFDSERRQHRAALRSTARSLVPTVDQLHAQRQHSPVVVDNGNRNVFGTSG